MKKKQMCNVHDLLNILLSSSCSFINPKYVEKICDRISMFLKMSSGLLPNSILETTVYQKMYVFMSSFCSTCSSW